MRLPFRERAYPLTLDATELVGPCVVTERAVWAVFKLAPQRWSFLTPEKRLALLRLNAKRWAQLAGHAVKLRVSSRPYASSQWAETMTDITPSPLPDVPGAANYDDYLRACTAGDVVALSHNGWLAGQQRRIRQARLDQKLVALMVRVADRPAGLTTDKLYAAMSDPSNAPRGLTSLVAALAKVTQDVSGAGFGATVIDPTELEWLFYRSCAPGLPVPSRLGVGGPRWETDDLSALVESVQWTFPPFGNVIEVKALRDGREHVGFAAALTVGRMEDISYPESGKSPWLTYTDRLEFPVEWVASGRILSGREMQADADFYRDRAINIDKHYRVEHGERPPRAVARAIEQAEEIVDQVTEGTADVAARFAGPIRAVVTGDSPEEVTERARALAAHMADSLNMSMEMPVAQAEVLAELIPVQRWRKHGFHRHMSVEYLAAAVPHTSAVIGDGRGPYIGSSAGTGRHAFMLDSNYAPEQMRRSGLCPIVGDPGAGKSFLTGLLAYQEARRGTQVVILDPSGPLARLCKLPELAPFAAHRSLTSGKPGSLSPPAMIVDPQRADFQEVINGEPRVNEDKYNEAVRAVRQERKQITIDTLRGLVPPSHRDAADVLLPRAVRGLDITPETSMWDVVARLDDVGVDGKELAEIIRDVAEVPGGSLALGEPGHAPSIDDSHQPFTVMSLAGIRPPATELPEAQWTMEMRLAQPLLNLAIMYASRFVWTGSPNTRRALHLDEVHFLRSWGSGRAFFMRLSRDSRKRNAAVFASSQTPEDILELGVASLFTHAFVGRIEDDDIAAEALRLVRAPDAYAPTITGLSREVPGEFLYRDVKGRVQRVVVDGEWLPALKTALRTNPDGSNAGDYGGTQ